MDSEYSGMDLLSIIAAFVDETRDSKCKDCLEYQEINGTWKFIGMKSLTKVVINQQKTAELVKEEAATEIFLKLMEFVELKNENNKENLNSSSSK